MNNKQKKVGTVGLKKNKRDWECKNDQGCDSEANKRCERFIDDMWDRIKKRWNCKMLMLSSHFLSQPVIFNTRFYLGCNSFPRQSFPISTSGKKNHISLPVISPVCSREIFCILVHIYGHHVVPIYGSGIWMQAQQSPKCKWVPRWKIKSSTVKPWTIEFPAVWNKIYGKAHEQQPGNHDRLDFKISIVEKFLKKPHTEQRTQPPYDQSDCLAEENSSNSYFLLHKARILRWIMHWKSLFCLAKLEMKFQGASLVHQWRMACFKGRLCKYSFISIWEIQTFFSVSFSSSAE